MAHLRCTSCDQRFDRPDVIRSGFKCPECGGLVLFDWAEEGPDHAEGPRGAGTRRGLGRWLRRDTR